MTTKDSVTFIKSNTAGWYSRQAVEYLLKEVDYAETNNSKREFLLPCLISSLCAGLECGINDGYIEFFHAKVGKNYKKYIQYFLSRDIRQRFKILILLISDYKYELDESNIEVKYFFELFDLRNRLLHAKNHMHEIVYDSTLGDWYEGFSFKELDSTDPYREKVSDIINNDELIKFKKLMTSLL